MQIVSSPMSAAVTNSIQEAYMSITCHWSHLKRMEWPMARRNSCTGRWPAAYSQQRLRRRFLWSNPTACLTTVTKWWDGSAPPDFAAGYFNPPTRYGADAVHLRVDSCTFHSAGGKRGRVWRIRCPTWHDTPSTYVSAK